jgi:hypothetical protein
MIVSLELVYFKVLEVGLNSEGGFGGIDNADISLDVSMSSD